MPMWKGDISDVRVELGYTSAVYNGTEKKPYVTVSDGGEELNQGIGYTKSYNNNVNAGTATVQIQGTGDFVGVKSAAFTINKLGQEISVVKSYRKTYGDKKFKLNSVHERGDGKFRYISSNPDVALVDKYGTVTIKRVGTTKITVIAGNTQNYREKSV